MKGYTEVFVWGGDQQGQLGLGCKKPGCYSLPRFCSFNIQILQVACGYEHSAILSKSGYVYCIGSNAQGSLGLGSQSVSSTSSPHLVETLKDQRVLKIACGMHHTLALTESCVYSWGSGEFGALGTGTTKDEYTPVLMNLPKEFVPEEIGCGGRHSGVVGQGVLYTCGATEAGQCGTGVRFPQLIPAIISIEEECCNVACGVFHTLVLTRKGRVYAMGGNSFGQLGIGNRRSQSSPVLINYLEGKFIKQIACGNFSAALSDRGDLYVWGTGSFGEFNLPSKMLGFSEPIRFVSLGGSFGVAVDTKSNVYSWGNNRSGELGLGDSEIRKYPVLVNSLSGRDVKVLSCGDNFCIALARDVYAKNDFSQTMNLSSISKNESFHRSDLDPSFKTSRPTQERSKSNHSEHRIKKAEDFSRSEMPSVRHKRRYSTDEENTYLKHEVQRLRKMLESSNVLKQRNNLLESEILKLNTAIQKGGFSQNQEIYHLEQDLNIANKHGKRLEQALADCEYKLQTALNEVTELKQKNSSLKNEKQKVSKINKDLTQEKLKLKTENEELYSNYSVVHSEQAASEKAYLNKLLEEQSYENERLKQENSEQSYQINSLIQENNTLKEKVNSLYHENDLLKQQIESIETKNSQTLSNIEKGLSQKAKDYREKTLGLLNTPKLEKNERYALSPEQIKRASRKAATQYHENNHDSPVKNLRITSPSRRSPDRPSPYNSKSKTSFTPSKNEVMTRIGMLLKDKQLLESKIKDL